MKIIETDLTAKLSTEDFHKLRDSATDDFSTGIPSSITTLVRPEIEGWKLAERTEIIIRSKNVEPHADDDLTCKKNNAYCAGFLILGTYDKSSPLFWFGCGKNTPIKIDPTKLVLFDPQQLHWVMADTEWFGLAWQFYR